VTGFDLAIGEFLMIRFLEGQFQKVNRLVFWWLFRMQRMIKMPFSFKSEGQQILHCDKKTQGCNNEQLELRTCIAD